MESFSTAGLRRSQKISFWNEISSATFAPMEIVPRDRECFEGHLAREYAGPLAFANVYTSPGIVRHTRAHLANTADRGHTLLAPIVGGFHLQLDRQPGVEAQVGDFCLVDHTMPYELAHHQSSQTFCVGIEAATLRRLLPKPERIAGVVIKPLCSASRMLTKLLQHLSAELELDSATLTGNLAQGLVGFVAAAYSEVLPGSPASLQETRKHSIKQFIDERLQDPQLRVTMIAAHFGISPRYLRLLFESEQESLSTYILRRRLQRCASTLRDANWRSLSITEIAFRNGFNNATHFGHAFKSEFGATPRDYRRLA